MSDLELLRALIVGAMLLLVPGFLLLRALGGRIEPYLEECPAVWFVLTLALLSPVAIASIAFPVSLELAIGWWVVTTAATATFVGLRRSPRSSQGRDRDIVEVPGPETGVSFPLAAMAFLSVCLLTYGAFLFTRGGSIDRWWYLAFVRSWLTGDVISAQDPMLGSGTFLARFAGNVWLMVLAMWARVAAVEPFAIYEHVAPMLLAPLAASATGFATRVVLESRRLSIAAVVVAALFWTSGSMFPALTRLPEDKLVAAVILAPVLWALVVDAARPDRGSGLSASAIPIGAAAICLASTHPLVFGISLLTVAPALLLAKPRVAVTLALCLALTATLPLALGITALGHVAEGESLTAADHPVGRIHLARDRVREIGEDIQVSPQMLTRPLTAIAIVAGLALALRDRRARVLLALPTALALGVCFVPALASAAARVVGPWMVYRFLWAIPFVQLLALVVDFAARWTRIGIALPLAAAAVLAAPHIGDAIRRQSGPSRMSLATPTDGPLAALAVALRALPRGSVIAAAPELSERIPGLSGHSVLAASDRATVVFSETREAAERRLQSRAAVLAGVWDAQDGNPAPTHIVFEPGAAASRYCARELFATSSHILCEFAARDPIPASPLREALLRSDETISLPRIGFLAASDAAVEGRVECVPEFTYGAGVVVFPKPGPWSARTPSASCTLRASIGASDIAGGDSPFRPQELEINLATGRTEEELLIVATGVIAGSPRWSQRTRRRVSDGTVLRFDLPRDDVDRIDVSLLPTYLPFVKVRTFSVILEPRRASPR